MNAARRFAAFWYDFVVGDDWMIAAGVVAALAAMYGLHRDGLRSWWFLPPAVILILVVALVRANRRVR
jgi:hypothetical protein